MSAVFLGGCNARCSACGRQAGVVLVIVLIFLVVLTLLGIASMGGANLGERIARNEVSHSLAHQAATAALRDAENDIRAGKPARSPQNFEANCAAGLCAATDEGAWQNANSWKNAVSYGDQTGATRIPGVAQQPQYLIEVMWTESKIGTNAIPLYRITAKGYGADVANVVMLQAYYVNPF